MRHSEGILPRTPEARGRVLCYEVLEMPSSRKTTKKTLTSSGRRAKAKMTRTVAVGPASEVDRVLSKLREDPALREAVKQGIDRIEAEEVAAIDREIERLQRRRQQLVAQGDAREEPAPPSAAPTAARRGGRRPTGKRRIRPGDVSKEDLLRYLERHSSGGTPIALRQIGEDLKGSTARAVEELVADGKLEKDGRKVRLTGQP